MSDAFSRILHEKQKQNDLFAFVFALKIRESNPGPNGANLFITEEKVTKKTMREYDRMGVNGPEGQKLF